MCVCVCVKVSCISNNNKKKSCKIQVAGDEKEEEKLLVLTHPNTRSDGICTLQCSSATCQRKGYSWSSISSCAQPVVAAATMTSRRGYPSSSRGPGTRARHTG